MELSNYRVAEALIYCTTSGGAAIGYAADYEKGKLAAARIFELFDTRPIISRFSVNARLSTVKGQVDFNKVNFQYQHRPTVKVLKDLTISVKDGESVAIVGPSGSGKSTCAALIFRFYDPVTGSVKFDGFNLSTLSIDFVRQQIGLVSQEPILFDCSIKENIAYGDNSREIPVDEIIEAAKATNMHNFISSLPAGYETRVGMLGNQMSGGQKQRIAIARAIIRQPKLLVLDEATSALDTESEVQVQTALDSAKTGRTSVTIAHRLSSIANCDKILVMKNGRLVESGTHQELIRSGGMYQAMWDAQSSQTN